MDYPGKEKLKGLAAAEAEKLVFQWVKTGWWKLSDFRAWLSELDNRCNGDQDAD